MKATINGITIEGTPAEMRELMTPTRPAKVTAQKLLNDAMQTYKKRKKHAWSDKNKKWSKATLHDMYTMTEQMLLNGTHITDIDNVLAKKYDVTTKTISVKRSQAGATVPKIMAKHNRPFVRGKYK